MIYMLVLDLDEWWPGILANLAFRLQLTTLDYLKLDSSHISGYVEPIREGSIRWSESDGSEPRSATTPELRWRLSPGTRIGEGAEL